MKKQFIAKLLVLAMVLALVPTAAFATTWTKRPGKGDGTNQYYWDAKNNLYYYYTEDVATTPAAPAAPAEPAKPSEPSTTTEPAIPEVTETVEEFKADQVKATDEGTTVTITATVKDGVASVGVTAAAIESLAEQVKGTTLTLDISAEGATKVAVTLPGKALVAMAQKTGVDVVMKSSIATITLPNTALTSILKDATDIAMSAGIDANGAYAISVVADGKAVTNQIKGLVVEF